MKRGNWGNGVVVLGDGARHVVFVAGESFPEVLLAYLSSWKRGNPRNQSYFARAWPKVMTSMPSSKDSTVSMV